LIPGDWQDMFKQNLWTNNSSILITPEPVDGEEAAPPEFEWVAEKGIAGCSEKILKEFVSMHSLKPIKIIISGHDNSGKSFFSSSVAEHYKIPVLSVKTIFEEFPPKNINTVCDENGKEVVVDAEFELVEDYKDLKEGVDELLHHVLTGASKNLEINEFSKVFYRILKWRLSQNDCINRGYVLDDPKLGINDLQTVFLDQKKRLKRIRPKPKKQVKMRKRKVVSETGEVEDTVNQITEGDQDGEKAPEEVAQEAPADGEPQAEGDTPREDEQIDETPEEDENGLLPGEEWVFEDYELQDDEEFVPEPERVEGEEGEQDGEGQEAGEEAAGEEEILEGEEEATGPKTEKFLPESVAF